MSALHGAIAERLAQHVAATLGVADFVYTAPVVRKGARGHREIGDGLLITGEQGALIQVKSRSPSAAAGESPDVAERRVRGFIEHAIRQGDGTRREILRRAATADPVRAMPVRALSFPVREREQFAVTLTSHCADWPLVVIVDHPANPLFSLDLPPKVFCTSLSDWRNLYLNLRSVRQVLRYVERALTREAFQPRFGAEVERFSRFVTDDAPYPDTPPTLLPSVAFATDSVGIAAYHELIEGVWRGITVGEPLTATDCRRIIAYLDDAPAALQATVGRVVLEHRRSMARSGIRSSGSITVDNRPFVFICDTVDGAPDFELWRLEVAGLTMARLAAWRDQLPSSPEILGVGLRTDGIYPEYTYVFGDRRSSVPPEVRRFFEWRYGVPDFRNSRVTKLVPARNERCPCGSQLKFKRCHGSPGQGTS